LAAPLSGRIVYDREAGRRGPARVGIAHAPEASDTADTRRQTTEEELYIGEVNEGRAQIHNDKLAAAGRAGITNHLDGARGCGIRSVGRRGPDAECQEQDRREQATSREKSAARPENVPSKWPLGPVQGGSSSKQSGWMRFACIPLGCQDPCPTNWGCEKPVCAPNRGCQCGAISLRLKKLSAGNEFRSIGPGRAQREIRGRRGCQGVGS
jgi:hypothetical protein